MKSSTETIIGALRVLARDIQTDDGVINACLSEAAERLEEMSVMSNSQMMEDDKQNAAMQKAWLEFNGGIKEDVTFDEQLSEDFMPPPNLSFITGFKAGISAARADTIGVDI